MKRLTALVLSAATLITAAPVLAQAHAGRMTIEAARESRLQERLGPRHLSTEDGVLDPSQTPRKRAEKTLAGIMSSRRGPSGA